MTDEQYMQLALELAEKGCGFVNSNPMVGAIIVKKEQ
jgi:Pyrimidine deaminase